MIESPNVNKLPGVDMDVAKVAHLARMHLTPDEAAGLQGQIDQILLYVNQLREVNVDGVEPTAHPMPMTAELRDDDCRQGLAHDDAMANAPSKRDGLFIVPKIVE